MTKLCEDPSGHIWKPFLYTEREREREVLAYIISFQISYTQQFQAVRIVSIAQRVQNIVISVRQIPDVICVRRDTGGLGANTPVKTVKIVQMGFVQVNVQLAISYKMDNVMIVQMIVKVV